MSQLSCYGIQEEQKPPMTIVKNEPCDDTYWIQVLIWVLLLLAAGGISYYSDMFTLVFSVLLFIYMFRTYFNPYYYYC